ncbi:TPA: hypothetical protein HA317_02920 [Candidatus Woesearchaeota archaeon]|nr:hypothetical protein [Candidatus Woesearchaeota archaeon]
MVELGRIYEFLLDRYGHQGWWPIINGGTLMCEYYKGVRRGEERLEVMFGCVLAQGTQWHPNVVRAMQQLKLGRPFSKQELEVIRQAEISRISVPGRHETKLNKHIVTQNTAWINAEKAVVELNKQDLIDVDRILKISHSQLTGVIKSAGYYNEKAKKLKNIARFLKDCPIAELQRMELAEARELLLSVRGVGRETADSILLYALNKLIFVVDAYTRRVFSNLGFIRPDADYDEVQALFMDNLPHEARLFNEYHALIVRHAKTYYSKKPYGIRCPLRAFIAGL